MPGLDVFRIRDEYMYLLTIGLSIIIVIICLLIFYDPSNKMQITISRLIYHFVAIIGSVGIVMIKIIYPYRVHFAIQRDLNEHSYKYGRQNSMTRSRNNTLSKSQPTAIIRRLKSKSSHKSLTKNRTSSMSKSTKNISPNLSPRFSPKVSPKLSPPRSCPSPIQTPTEFQLNGSSSPNNNNNQQQRNRPKSITEMIGMASTTPITVSSPIPQNTASLSRQQTPRDNSSYNNKVTLDQVMKELVGIEAFLKHLVKELSAENLFFLSDVVQYKTAFVEDGLLDDIFDFYLELPEDIPKSHILEEPDHYERAKAICDKYIRQNSEREINISWGTRVAITNAFDKLDVITKPSPLEFSTRFDFAAAEIKKLLSDSFRRFCLTPVGIISTE